ncbi:MAG TPA: dehydrogenase, partial [Lachnospiraceae bacterium]|nr:dehydrogenase [Lachnospiraceae bacterium]
MIKITNLKCPIDHDDELIKRLVGKKLGIDISAITGFKIIKRSLDARKKPELIYILSLEVSLDRISFDKLRNRIKKGKIKDVSLSKKENNRRPFEINHEKPILKGAPKPVIVGFGPAGIFAALTLSRMGLRPVIFERGSEVKNRQKKCDIFFE